ncbi:hypothetical protein BDV93DRAFT_434777 [Ceratobasidium sp. AG-I]|nr:hypothetical protein BDV93DRAFT_434777 [Ceratobasidium sp. AG-I]
MKLLALALTVSSVSAAPLSFGIPSKRALPTPVDVDTARTYLAELVVAVDSNTPAYARNLFPTWDIISGKCDTRETVLIRDGTNAVTDSSCASKSGTRVSPYDNATWIASSDVDIDHLVPLKEAWVSGARDWTTARREALANDLTRPQLLAVTDSVNESKGDRDPAKWMPPLASYYCTHIQAWITVKYYYELTIDSAEKTALANYLAAC